MRIQSIGRLTASLSLTLSLTACAGGNLGALGDILGDVLAPAGGAQQGQLVVEIQSVNTQQQAIQVMNEQGQTGAVHYDQNTVVVYQQQQYPVTALERGDIVSMQVQQMQNNQLYTNRIDVQQSVQQRAGGTTGGQLQQFSGTVRSIDHNNGVFQLQTQQGTLVVTLPYNPGPATTDYFHRLRNGHSVQIEGTFTGSNRVQLHRFI